MKYLYFNLAYNFAKINWIINILTSIVLIFNVLSESEGKIAIRAVLRVPVMLSSYVGGGQIKITWLTSGRNESREFGGKVPNLPL